MIKELKIVVRIEGEYTLIRCNELHINTFGRTWSEAFKNFQEVYELVLEMEK